MDGRPRSIELEVQCDSGFPLQGPVKSHGESNQRRKSLEIQVEAPLETVSDPVGDTNTPASEGEHMTREGVSDSQDLQPLQWRSLVLLVTQHFSRLVAPISSCPEVQ
jgi:hypothetical protein